MNRREFLTAAGSLAGSASLFPAGALSLNEGKIDVHHHIGQIGNARNRVNTGPSATRQSSWTPQNAVEELDRNNVALAVLSAASAGGGSTGGPDRRKQSRDWNEYAAQLVRDYKGRF